jgi:hypothetical protein
VSYEVVDHQTRNQFVTLARKHCVKYDQLVGAWVPN